MGVAKLSTRDVSLIFKNRGQTPVTALERVSLDVSDREFAVIVGPSGCGKSSILYLVAGLQKPSTGTILLDGAAVDGPSRQRGMVFQSYTLFPWLTVLQNVAFGPSLRGVPTAERLGTARDYVREVGLEGFEDAYPRQLSGGMMQRVALARAMANDPEVLLMDEPFGALDSQTRSIMQQLLLRIWEQHHKTVLFVTHDIEEAIFLADRIYVMTARPGRIKEEIVVTLPRPRTVEMMTSEAFVALKRRVMDILQEEVLRSLGLASAR
jgi:ABC-type nitrate/sulfonate/bicarbonate transport system ATPase subunit